MNDVNRLQMEINTLECSLTRLRRQMLALSIVMGLALFASFSSPAARSPHDALSARHFIVTDENGDTRAVLGMHSESDSKKVPPHLRNPANPPTARSFAALRLLGEEGSSIRLAVDEEDGPTIRLQNEERGGEALTLLGSDGMEVIADSEYSYSRLVASNGHLSIEASETDDEDADTDFMFSVDPVDGILEVVSEVKKGLKSRFVLELKPSQPGRLVLSDSSSVKPLLEVPEPPQ